MAQAGNMSDMLQSLLSALNSEDKVGRDAHGAPDTSGESQDGRTESSDPTGGFNFNSFFENIDFDMLMKAGELFARFNSPDRNTELLRALKPHMREENREKIDTAIKLIKVTALLPFLRESGLFDKIF